MSQSDEGRHVLELDREYVFHSWSAQGALNPMCIAGAEGCYFWDYDGNRYLDFSSQLVNTNIGHQHPKVVAAIQEQAAKLSTIAPQHANDARGEAAKRIVDVAGGHMAKVFFTNGGADAVENAIKMARVHTRKHKVLSAYRSYHGNTAVAITATGEPRRWPNEYATMHKHFFGPHLYRTEFWSTSQEQESERALEHLEHVIQFEGPSTIAAIILESVIGTAGILVPPPGYLEGLRALCDKYGIVWIADEVMAGFGRTGKWFAYQNWDAQPDLIVFAKGVNSGYVPAGGVVISDKIAATFNDQMFPGGLTYSGHPLAAASIVATIDVMHEEGIVENAAMIGETVLGPGLRDLADRHPVIGDVRGLGVFWGLDLVTDRKTREPLAPYGGTSPAMAELVAESKKRGLMPFINMNRLHVVPPCIVSEGEVKEGLDILDEVFTIVDQHYVG
jgi:taurine---2-oxoglutarate transaminase